MLETVKEFNLASIGYINAQEYAKALEVLKKAETLCELNDKAKAMNFNNIACYYRK